MATLSLQMALQTFIVATPKVGLRTRCHYHSSRQSGNDLQAREDEEDVQVTGVPFPETEESAVPEALAKNHPNGKQANVLSAPGVNEPLPEQLGRFRQRLGVVELLEFYILRDDQRLYMHCGCDLEEALLDFYIWKTSPALVSRSTGAKEKFGKPVDPRTRLYFHAVLESLDVHILDLYCYDLSGRIRREEKEDQVKDHKAALGFRGSIYEGLKCKVCGALECRTKHDEVPTPVEDPKPSTPAQRSPRHERRSPSAGHHTADSCSPPRRLHRRSSHSRSPTPQGTYRHAPRSTYVRHGSRTPSTRSEEDYPHHRSRHRHQDDYDKGDARSRHEDRYNERESRDRSEEGSTRYRQRDRYDDGKARRSRQQDRYNDDGEARSRQRDRRDDGHRAHWNMSRSPRGYHDRRGRDRSVRRRETDHETFAPRGHQERKRHRPDPGYHTHRSEDRMEGSSRVHEGGRRAGRSRSRAFSPIYVSSDDGAGEVPVGRFKKRARGAKESDDDRPRIKLEPM